MSIKISDKDTTTLRFPVGTRVECNCGQWKPGTIVKHFYVQSSFPEGMCVPYQVKLDEGNKMIFAPADVDRVIRQLAEEPAVMGLAEDEFMEEIEDKDKLPITVITGFLGAGKTTLINHILTEKHGVRVCVIENEFGSVDIDTSLVKENMNVAEEIISLDNGCACCTVRGDLLKALTQLKERRSEFDMVLLETTGVANPAPVVSTFTQNPVIANSFRVDGIVCLVDSKHVTAHLEEKKADDAVNEAVCQVAFADRILLNKVDLVTKEELRTLKEVILSINSFAELYETERSKVDITKLLNISSFSIERMNASLEEFEIDVEDTVGKERQNPTAAQHNAYEHGHGEAASSSVDVGDTSQMEHDHMIESDHGHDEGSGGADCDQCVEEDENKILSAGGSGSHAHDHQESAAAAPKKKKKHDLSGVGSLGLTATTPLISHEFNAFMSDLLRHKAKDLYRSKGVLAFVEEGDAKFIFQGVHEQIQYTTAQVGWQPDEPKISKVVFIGRDLDHDELRAGWARCHSGEKKEAKKGFLSGLLG